MEGYQKLSTFIASNSEYALFRKFANLQTQNLLYLQAELTHLEAQLAGIIQEDAKASQNANPAISAVRWSIARICYHVFNVGVRLDTCDYWSIRYLVYRLLVRHKNQDTKFPMSVTSYELTMT